MSWPDAFTIGAVASAGGVPLSERLIAAAGSATILGVYTGEDVATNGSGRFRWTDMSGNDAHLDSQSAAGDPTQQVHGSLGNVVRLDGTDDYLLSVKLASYYKSLHDDTVNACGFVLHDPVDDDQAEWIWATAQNGTTQTGVIANVTYNNGRHTGAIGDGVAGVFNEFAQGPDPSNVPTIHAFRLESSTGYTQVWWGSGNMNVTSAALSDPASTADPNRTLNFGWRPGVGNYLGSDVRAAIYMTGYTNAERDAVRDVLKSAGGIT